MMFFNLMDRCRLSLSAIRQKGSKPETFKAPMDQDGFITWEPIDKDGFITWQTIEPAKSKVLETTWDENLALWESTESDNNKTLQKLDKTMTKTLEPTPNTESNECDKALVIKGPKVELQTIPLEDCEDSFYNNTLCIQTEDGVYNVKTGEEMEIDDDYMVYPINIEIKYEFKEQKCL